MELKPEDLVINSWSGMRKSGWSVAPDNGVSIVHRPTGAMVQVDTERSQHANKAIAMKMMESKVETLLVERARPPAPSAAAGEQVPAWDADATTRLRSIVDLLGLQSSVPDGDLTGYEFAVLGFVRREIERLKSTAQPTPAQSDAVPVATKCAACNGEGWVRDIHDMEQGRIRCTKCAARQSSADAVDAELINYLQSLVDEAGKRGLRWDSFHFNTDKTVREQIAAAIAAQGGKEGA